MSSLVFFSFKVSTLSLALLLQFCFANGQNRPVNLISTVNLVSSINTKQIQDRNDEQIQLNNSLAAARKPSRPVRRKIYRNPSSTNIKKTQLPTTSFVKEVVSAEQIQSAIEKSFEEQRGFFFSSYIRSTTAFQGFSLSPAIFKPIGINDHYILGNGEGTLFVSSLGLSKSFASNLVVGAEFGLSCNISSYYGGPVVFQLNSDNQASSISFNKAFISFLNPDLGVSTWLGLREINIQDVPTMTMRIRSLYGTGVGVENISLSRNNSVKMNISFLTSANPFTTNSPPNKQTLFLLDTSFVDISVPNSSAKLGVQITPMFLANIEGTQPTDISKKIGLQFALNYEQDSFWGYKQRNSSGNFLFQVGYGPGMNFSSPYPYSYVPIATAGITSSPTTPPPSGTPYESLPSGDLLSLDAVPVHIRCFYYGVFDILEDIQIQMVTGSSFMNTTGGNPQVWVTSGVRPIFHLGNLFHIQTEYAIDITSYSKNTADKDSPNFPLLLNKLTIAPGFKFPGNLPGNPTISMFGTLGFWNKSYMNKLGVQKRDANFAYTFPKDQNYAFSWGFQIEASL